MCDALCVCVVVKRIQYAHFQLIVCPFLFLLLIRRAQLRDCLEVLRQHVPFPDKLTTLALLQSARKYIEVRCLEKICLWRRKQI